MANTNKNVVATFTDRYGDERTIHHTRHGLVVRRDTQTVSLALNQPIALHIGQRIKTERLRKGWTLAQLCTRAGLTSANTPKSRMWEIENSMRQQGIRLGTLYAIAHALGVEATALMPTVAESIAEANVEPRDIGVLEPPA